MTELRFQPTETVTDEKVRKIANALADVKGNNIVVLDVTQLATFSEYFVLSTGNSHVHMKALADRVRQTMAAFGARISHSEGQESQTWILLDFSDVIVHIFSPSARDYYGLDQLWGDAKITPWIPNAAPPKKENTSWL